MKVFMKRIGAVPGVTEIVLEGFRKHGLDVQVAGSDMGRFDMYVFWGHRQRRLINLAKRAGVPYLVVELAYLGKRDHWISMGFNGLNGRADFNNVNVPADRWEKHWQHQMKPWKKGGDYALICGQVPGDAALEHVDINRFYRDAAQAAREKHGKVFFRPHPWMPEGHRELPGVPTLDGSLEDALAGAKCVYTCNSNTGVDAAMAGVPVYAYDSGSMAWEVAQTSLTGAPLRPDREDWGRKIAYCQWLPEEVQNGDAWEHLKSGVKRACKHR